MAERSVSTLFDDEEDDFLSSWKPTSVMTHDKGLKVDDVQPVKAKRKPFTSPKLDIDFDFEMPSFNLDLEGLDFNIPFNPQPKSKPDKDKSLKDIDDFPFNLKRSDNITKTSKDSKESKVDSPAPSAKSVNNSVPKEVPIIADPEVTDIPHPESKLCQKEMGDIKAVHEGEQLSSKERNHVLTRKENNESGARMSCPPEKLPVQIRETDIESESFPYRPEERPSSEAQSVSLPSEDQLKQSEAVEIAQVISHPTSPEDKHTEDRHPFKFKTSKESDISGGTEIIKIHEQANKHTRLKELSSTPVKEQQSLLSNAGARQSCQMLEVQEKESTEAEKDLVGNTLVKDNILLQNSMEQRSDNTKMEKIGASQDIKRLQQGLNINEPDHIVAPPINDEKSHVQEETVADPMDNTPVINVPVTKSVYFGKTLQSLPQVPFVKAITRDYLLTEDYTMVKNNIDGKLARRDINRSPVTPKGILTTGDSLTKEQKAVRDLVKINTAASRSTVFQPLGGTDNSKQCHLIEGKEGQGDIAGTNKRKLTNENKKNDRRQVRWQTSDKLMPKRDETKLGSLLKPSIPAACLNILSSRSEWTSTTTAIVVQAANNPKRNKSLRWADRLQSSAQVQRTGLSVQSKRVRKMNTDASENRLGLADLARSKNIDTNRIRSDNTFQFSQRPTIQPNLELNAPTTVALRYSPKTRAEPEGLQAGARTTEESLGARNVKISQQSFASAETSAVLTQSSVEVLMSERRSIIEHANSCSERLDEMMRTLKKLNGEAKDLIVRALVCNNKLLMMQSPMNEEKIQILKASILEVLNTESSPTEVV